MSAGLHTAALRGGDPNLWPSRPAGERDTGLPSTTETWHKHMFGRKERRQGHTVPREGSGHYASCLKQRCTSNSVLGS